MIFLDSVRPRPDRVPDVVSLTASRVPSYRDAVALTAGKPGSPVRPTSTKQNSPKPPQEPPVTTIHPDVARTARMTRQLDRIDRAGDVLAELLVGPHLGGARPACAGASPSHDLDVHGEPRDQRAQRHAAAVEVCRTCPALTACRAVLVDLRASRLTGVWAGLVLDDAPGTRGAQRREAS